MTQVARDKQLLLSELHLKTCYTIGLKLRLWVRVFLKIGHQIEPPVKRSSIRSPLSVSILVCASLRWHPNWMSRHVINWAYSFKLQCAALIRTFDAHYAINRLVSLAATSIETAANGVVAVAVAASNWSLYSEVSGLIERPQWTNCELRFSSGSQGQWFMKAREDSNKNQLHVQQQQQ